MANTKLFSFSFEVVVLIDLFRDVLVLCPNT